jgi:hypothetical protein
MVGIEYLHARALDSYLFVIKPQLPAAESQSWHLDVMQGCGSETICPFPPNSDEKHPAGFDTSIHENGHNPKPALDPASFAIFSPPSDACGSC